MKTGRWELLIFFSFSDRVDQKIKAQKVDPTITGSNLWTKQYLDSRKIRIKEDCKGSRINTQTLDYNDTVYDGQEEHW